MRHFRLRFLTRAGCHLCDDARPLVQRVAAKVGAQLDEIDIEVFPELEERYGTRIPVILGPDDQVIAEGIIDDRRALTRVVKRSARSAG